MAADGDLSTQVPFHWGYRESRILPIAVRAAEEQTHVGLRQIAHELDLPEKEVRVALEELDETGFIKLQRTGGMQLFLVGVRERGRVLTGSWPSSENFVEQLAAALSVALEHEPDGERRQWIRQTRDGLLGIGRDLFLTEIRLLLRTLGLPA